MTRTKARRGAKKIRTVGSSCPCGKRNYASEGDATQAIAQANGFAGQRVYQCPYADVWHTTSKRANRTQISLTTAERDLIHAVRAFAEARRLHDQDRGDRVVSAHRAAMQAFADASDPKRAKP